ncbi:phosphatidate cytidylyltransferase [Lactiplantibacillus pentosus]|uniref:Phosphatidate cytidylyltransferase n=1 Tax=Lactiplantibacillus pentosus TaxID=1589 RepID=A0AB37RCK4_LACPE|nr:phosphatidate cytidylyltransferase [Lactiplantibacillus pentosus]RMW41047.1 phosphatidate cytidylyltransferase [Lactiplantibacillus pentosus]RMW41435.1 phosphatidate cytidylyltransferase [Lactiplantibacillus pentosus]RMW50740.1 phosphatidate cytidylyltransferase [Lactiplantibacillus pentosus]RMW51412.1 phosphatidate cytidylyltransferase [Lactiplantibacillus pentosus]
MKQRVITAVVALILFIPVIFVGGITLDIVAMLLGAIAMSELLIMRKKLLISFEAIVSMLAVMIQIAPTKWFNGLPDQLNKEYVVYFLVILLLLHTVWSRNRFSFDDAGVLTLGILYIGMGFNYFTAARGINVEMLLFLMFIVWATDSGAYMVGRKLGKHKVTPISPNKTWEGCIGGSVIGVIIASAFAIGFHVGYASVISMILITIVLSIVGQFGDLVESALKRYYGVKDSGKILPGHGGILDRFDSMLLVFPIAHLFGLF